MTINIKRSPNYIEGANRIFTKGGGRGINTLFSSAAPPPPPPGYTITLGTKAPVLGSGGQVTFPAPGWEGLVASSEDDSFRNILFPFTWNFNGTAYSNFYPGSNTYITFGAGSTLYYSLSESSPPHDKIHIAARDNSWQRVSVTTSDTDYIRLRYEGTPGTGGTPGTPGIVYEITFFNPALTGGVPWFELLVGVQNRGTTGAISGIYGPSSLLPGGGLGPVNQGVSPGESYVCVGNTLGTLWTVYTGYHVANTGY